MRSGYYTLLPEEGNVKTKIQHIHGAEAPLIGLHVDVSIAGSGLEANNSEMGATLVTGKFRWPAMSFFDKNTDFPSTRANEMFTRAVTQETMEDDGDLALMNTSPASSHFTPKAPPA